MDLDKTIELITTLDRAAVEAKLEEVRQGAESMLLAACSTGSVTECSMVSGALCSLTIVTTSRFGGGGRMRRTTNHPTTSTSTATALAPTTIDRVRRVIGQRC